ncbi:MAG: bacteriohemerythrin [Terracidiphilus sp.]
MFISRLKSLHQKVSGTPEPQQPLIAWTSQMSVHVKLLDNDHKKLLILLSDLHIGVLDGYVKPILDQTFEALIRSTRAHFAHEEQLFTETAFPGAITHEREHDHILDRLKVLQARFRNCAESASSLEVIHLLKNCILNHIEVSDQKYVAHLKEREVGSILAESEAQPAVVMRKQPMPPRILQGAW